MTTARLSGLLLRRAGQFKPGGAKGLLLRPNTWRCASTSPSAGDGTDPVVRIIPAWFGITRLRAAT